MNTGSKKEPVNATPNTFTDIKIEINKRQAREFALAVYMDIADYIEAHQAEYEEFLKERGLHNENKR